MLGTRHTTHAALPAVGALALAVAVSALASPGGAGKTQGISNRSARSTPVSMVVAVSVDGLNPSALRRLGKRGAPTLHRLMAGGAGTLNARTERELSNTLPNHTGMVTGRRVTAAYGGHGVTWNDDRRHPPTVQAAAGHAVASVFTQVAGSGGRTAMFAAKTKFSLFERSWPGALHKAVINGSNAVLVRKVRRDLVNRKRAFTFVHLSAPDAVGHAHGFMTPAYLAAVRRTDRLIGKLVATIRNHRSIRRHLALIVTADHGGGGGARDHADETLLRNFRIPFLVWGRGVARGKSLYALNPDYRNPGTRRPAYSERRQPVRNGDLANLTTDLLGLNRVPGSEHDAGLDLDVSGG